ncbi:MAG: response regulator [Lachnospiraceae bacterium]|nr:response regulator [Lachnospiraceae bacterium]
MIIALYALMMLFSIIEFIVFSQISIKTTSKYMFLLFGLIIVCNMGYLSLALSSNLSEAILANKVTYFGGVFVPFLMFMTISSVCDFKVPPFLVFFMELISVFVIISVFTIGYSDVYYKSVDIRRAYGVTYLVKEYGPLHTVYTVALFGEIIGCFIVVIYSMKKKKCVSRRTTSTMMTGLIAGVLLYSLERAMHWKVDVMPIMYVIFELMLLAVLSRTHLYDVSAVVAELYDVYRQYAYITLDKENRFMGCNDLAKEVYPELTDVKVDSKDYVKEGDFYRDIVLWVEEFERVGLSAINREFDKKNRNFRGTVKSILKRDRRSAGYLVELEDITRQQEYIKLIRKYNNDLKTEIVEKTKAKNEADSANNAKSNFLANMSHEIRTPLNVVLGMDELIIEELKDESKNAEEKEKIIEEYAQNISSSGNLLLSIINDILDLSKIESGKMEIIEGPYHFAQVIKDIVVMFENKAQSKHLSFELEAEGSLPDEVRGDEMRVRQIIINLLNNAIKYTDKGSVKLTVSARKYSQEGKRKVDYTINVKDTGKGIKEEDLDKLFYSFTRVDEDNNKNIEGTGLGLSIVKKLVDMMDGKIEVKSSYGEGSDFCVLLPQELLSERSISEYNEAEKKLVNENVRLFRAPKANLLLVDDNSLNIVVAKKFLEQTGADIKECLSGKEAIDLLKEKKYDLVYLDHMMPGLDGIDVIKAVRSDRQNPNRETVFIAMTANALSGARDYYLKAGFDAYISKPIKKKELLNITGKYLDQGLMEKESVKELYKEETDQKKEISDLNDPMNTAGSKSEKKEIGSKVEEDKKNLRAILDKELAMENCMGDEEMYRSLALVYLEEAEGSMEKLREHYDKGDLTEYAVVAHGIKSTSLYIGAKELSDLAKEMELAAKSGDRALISEKHEQLIKSYKEVCEELHKEL